ncbi:hypothetical protein PRIPAC_70557 [Pristionchus pacificus]|uniref:BPI1 domain-containing protein n=1 Tax=Pristionchus pacificus TaxID=54126 RepID=A0A2A6CRS9_PRIPA|nr:hypothetical protein PRIPAC_70557 [Pristionchus pacificus]|eukprot:PDM80767.1 hypothetical protein PRIPAC_35770 [Pristionchus pacificus]
MRVFELSFINARNKTVTILITAGMKGAFLLSLVFGACLHLSDSVDQHAIATVRLNKSLFQLASGKAKSFVSCDCYIDDLVPKMNISDFRVTSGTITFAAQQISITHFDFPRTTFAISKQGLTWHTTGGKIAIRMKFVVKWDPLHGGPRLTVVGWATVTVEDLRTNLNAIIKTINARPQVTTTECYTNVDNLDIQFDEKTVITDWVLAAIRPKILGKIRDFLDNNACKLIAEQVQVGNKFIRDQPEEIHIWKNIYLNYTASKDPIFHDDFVEAECSFRVAISDNKTSDIYFEDGSFVASILEDFIPSRGPANNSTAIGSGNGFSPRTILIMLRDILLYVLAAYALYGIIHSVVMKILWKRRIPNFPTPVIKAYANLAHASATLRLNKSFFRLASVKVKHIIQYAVRDIRIPAINVTTEPRISFATGSTNLTQFDFPRTTFTISKDGLAWNSVGGKIELKTEYFVSWEMVPGGPRMGQNGNASITVRNLQMHLNGLIKSVGSRSQLFVNACSFGIETLDVVFDAYISDFEQIRTLLLSDIKKRLRNIAFEGVSADKFPCFHAKRFVREQPGKIHIWRNIYLNYALTEDPIFHDDFIEAECSIRFTVSDNATSMIDFDTESFIHDVMDSMESHHHVFTPSIDAAPAYLIGSIVSLLRDIFLFVMAAYGIICTFHSILKTFFFLLFLPVLPCSISTEPEPHAIVTARLEKSLFELASSMVKQIINDEVPKIPLPSYNEKFAGIRVRSRWIRWDGFEAPRTNFTISEEGLRWETSGGSVKIKSQFDAKWALFKKTGIIDFTATDLRTSVQATVRNKNSRPQIEVKHCANNVGRVRVHIHAKLTGFFINLFRKYIEESLSDTIRREACKMVNRFVDKANNFINYQPEEILIWSAIAFNYSVIGEPSFSKDAIEAASSFRFVVGNFSNYCKDGVILDVDDDLIDDLVLVDSSDAHPPSAIDLSGQQMEPFKLSLKDVFLYIAALIGAINLLAKCRE